MQHPWSPHQFAAEARRLGRPEAMIAAATTAGRAVKARDPDLPVIFSLSHLAHLAGVAPATVRAYVTKDQALGPYRVFKLRKRSKPNSRAPVRGFRTICVPEPNLMRLQRWIAQNILSKAVPHPTSFAYFPDRGVLRAAERHCGCSWLVKMDIRDFFDSIKEKKCYRIFRSLGYGALLSFELARICTRARDADRELSAQLHGVLPYRHRPEGCLPQGAPTSPALANMAVYNLDKRLGRKRRSSDGLIRAMLTIWLFRNIRSLVVPKLERSSLWLKPSFTKQGSIRTTQRL